MAARTTARSFLTPLPNEATDFAAAWLKPLRGLTPYEAICKAWADQPVRFTSDPHRQLPEPNTQ